MEETEVADEHNPDQPMPTEGGTDAGPQGIQARYSDIGSLAVGAGFAGLLAYPWLIGYPVARYAILVADVVALTLGVWLLWRAVRRSGRYDMAIAALVTSGVSLYFFVAYMTGPPPAPGST